MLCLLVLVSLFSVPLILEFSTWNYYKGEVDRLTPALAVLRRKTSSELALQDDLRRKWAIEVAVEERRQEDIRLRWKNETKAEADRQEAVRQRWALEEQKEHNRQVRLRYEWDQETIRWEDERRRRAEERWREDEEKRDAEDRERMHLHWDTPHPAQHCARYGAREYSARLWNVRDGYDWVRACEKTPVAIHSNVIARPDWCEVRGGVIGHWIVPFDENNCEARWSDFLDMGCADRSIRRIESELWGVHKGENALHLCETAPATIRDTPYDKPTRCFERSGKTIAIWEITDSIYC